MPKMAYCWRCKIEVPMLDEREWQEIMPDLTNGIRRMQEYRRTNDATIREAKDHVYGQGALRRYFDMTGFRETNPNAIWHHRLSLLGPPCAFCGKPLRTPRARLCAACGASTGA